MADLELITVNLSSTVGTDTWTVKVPLDVQVRSIIAKLLQTPDLGFRERDDSGYLIPYRLLWQEGSRYLNDAETLRHVGVEEGHQIILTHEIRSPRLLELRWDRLAVEIAFASQRWETLLPVDVSIDSLLDRLLRSSQLEVRLRDESGRKIRYGLRWNEANRLLAPHETLDHAGVKLGDTLSVVPQMSDSTSEDRGNSTSPCSEAAPRNRENLFISHSGKDRDWLSRLQVHLRAVEKRGLIERWDDTRIQPGMDWRKQIEDALGRARVAVLLVSADFLASEFISENELPPLLAAAESDGLRILPVIVRPCLFEENPDISRYQAINPPTRPLSAMGENEQEQALVNVARSVLEFLRPT